MKPVKACSSLMIMKITVIMIVALQIEAAFPVIMMTVVAVYQNVCFPLIRRFHYAIEMFVSLSSDGFLMRLNSDSPMVRCFCWWHGFMQWLSNVRRRKHSSSFDDAFCCGVPLTHRPAVCIIPSMEAWGLQHSQLIREIVYSLHDTTLQNWDQPAVWREAFAF